MSRKKDKQNWTVFIRWAVVLAGMLILMTALAVYLKLSPALQPQETAPTLPPNPYCPTDFAWEEDRLVYLSGRSIPGIDVSAHQGQIDWQAVRSSGVEFAFIRLGYRGYTSGTLHQDEYALKNLRQAKAAGLQIGAYFFSQALSAEEARQEARFALEILGDTPLDLPLVYDWEYVSEEMRTGHMAPQALVECVHAFCGEVARAGYEPMIYFNQELSKTLLDLTQVSEFPFWFAKYSDRMDFPYRIRFWQYSDTGRVPGIEGDVDLNLYFP